MAEIRTSSGDRRVRGFQTSSAGGNPSDSPRPVSGRNGNRDGMGWDGQGRKAFLSDEKKAAFQRSSDTFAAARRFTEQLPAENSVFVASAYLSERHRLKREPSPAEVLERLRITGRAA